jgi:hypothetical protein
MMDILFEFSYPLLTLYVISRCYAILYDTFALSQPTASGAKPPYVEGLPLYIARVIATPTQRIEHQPLNLPLCQLPHDSSYCSGSSDKLVINPVLVKLVHCLAWLAWVRLVSSDDDVMHTPYLYFSKKTVKASVNNRRGRSDNHNWIRLGRLHWYWTRDRLQY